MNQGIRGLKMLFILPPPQQIEHGINKEPFSQPLKDGSSNNGKRRRHRLEKFVEITRE